MAASQHDIPMPHVIQSPEVNFSLPISTSNIKNKTIIITGGASGLGAGFFETWAEHGAAVIIGDISEAAGIALVAKVRKSTGNANLHFVNLDVTNWDSQSNFFREAARLSPHGGIDCVVANAGIGGGPDSMAFEDPPDFTTGPIRPAPTFKTIDINLVGVMYTSHLAISYLSRNPGSKDCSVDTPADTRDRHLVLIASMAGLQPIITVSVYGATKHAVVGLFRALRATMPVAHGIRVNMLCPYFVRTPILGIMGSAIMAGAGVAEAEAVVDAATRLVADQSIVGRGLAIGPRVNREDAMSVGLKMGETENERAVWDVYAHDSDQSDVFSRRVIALTNLAASRRGWSVFLGDLTATFTSPIRRLLGL